MARTDLTQDKSTANVSAYSTASITPGSNRVILAFVLNVRSGIAQAAQPTAQGNGLTWQAAASVQVTGAPNRRLTCFSATGAAPTPGPLSFDFGGEQQTLCAWSVFEYDVVAGIAQVKTASGGAPMPTVTLDPLADANKSVVVGGVIANSLFGTPAQVTPGQGLTEIHEQDVTEPGTGGSLQTEERTGGGTTVNWTAFVQSWAAIALELTAGISAADALKLAKQFEPILYFHAAEKFYPSNAKRYIKMCALWRVQSPFDVKDFWGRKEPPPYDYPRAPIIGYKGIAAVKGEQGTFLGDDLVNTASEERSLDLSGWKDASGMGDSTVTATSKNTYSNRSAVATRYDASGDLADSKYWYHVEMFEELRLRRLLSGVRAPNLVKVLDDLKVPDVTGDPPKEVALLCYYFFFPAHEEGPIPGCTNVEAKEFGSFAGEWVCMALLLRKDKPSAPFKPSYIGMSGRGPYAATPPRGQAADSDDMARRSVMMVFPFATSESIGEHPKIFVANGTHSLYPMAGTFAVSYSAGAPGQCGLVEPAAPKDHPGPLEAPGIFLAKLLAAAASGSVLGLFALAGALVAAGLEGVLPPHGLNVTGELISGPDDVTGPPGSGKVVRPENLAVPDGGSDLQNWMSKAGATIGGKPYDHLVDRDKQPWWPSDSGLSGYQGRWGPRVESDPFSRRAGMRFPTFWRTFFLAFVNGKDAKAF